MSDRLSFMRFAGLSLSDETPDHSTIWRFRQKLIEGGLAEKLFAEVVD
ncbi:MAG: transposase, partial [Reyranella sp.]|nr:transposase [Reyranella sp.]